MLNARAVSTHTAALLDSPFSAGSVVLKLSITIPEIYNNKGIRGDGCQL